MYRLSVDPSTVAVAKIYWGHHPLSVKTKHELEMRNRTLQNLPLPPGFFHGTLPPGLAAEQHRTIGVAAFLASPNLLPTDEKHVLVRNLTELFDQKPQKTTHAGFRPYGVAKEMVIRKYSRVFDIRPNPDLRIHPHIGLPRGNNIAQHYQSCKKWCAALLVAKEFLGYLRTFNRGFKLLDLATDADPENREVLWFGVLPMLFFIVTEMDPYEELDLISLLSIDIGRIPDSVVSRMRGFQGGIWSEQVLSHRMNLPLGHPEGLSAADQFAPKGLEFRFARMLSLLIPDLWIPRWPNSIVLFHFLTNEQLSLLYLGYDAHTPSIYGFPGGFGKTRYIN